MRHLVLTLRLGHPDFLRHDGNAQTWQYRLASCVVDFFVYPEGDGEVITGWAWRAPIVGERIDRLKCRQALARREEAQN